MLLFFLMLPFMLHTTTNAQAEMPLAQAETPIAKAAENLAQAKISMAQAAPPIRYSIEMHRNSNIATAREHASVASGLVKYQCRLINQVGTFVARCGMSEDPQAFDQAISRLHQLGFNEVKVVRISSEVVLFNYEPITLDETSQQHLVEVAQRQSLFTVEKTSKNNRLDETAFASLSDELEKQGAYFVDRGWQALNENDLEFSLSMFQLATQINASKWDAKFGVAVVNIKQQNWQQALDELEALHQQEYSDENLLPQLVNAAFNAQQFTKARVYTELLPTEARMAWRKRLRGQEMIEALAKITQSSSRAQLSQFKRDFQLQLDDCNPYLYWVDFADLAGKRGDRKLKLNVYRELLASCSEQPQKIAILYQIKKLMAGRDFIVIIERQTQISAADIKPRLKQIHIETLLDLASRESQDLNRQYAIIQEALALNPRSFNAQLLLGWNHYNQKKYQPAEQVFDRLWRPRGSKKALEGLLYSYAATDRLDSAIDLATKHKMDKQLLVLLKNKLGTLDSNSEQAAMTATLILQRDPLYQHAHSTIAWYHFNQKRWAESEQAFLDWQEVEPDNLSLLEGLILTLNKQKNYPLAYQYAQHYQSLSPALKQQVQIDQASDAFARGDYPLAIELLKQIVQRQPANLEMKTLLAWSYFKQAQWQDALDQFRPVYAITNTPDIAQAIASCLGELSKQQLDIFMREIREHSNWEITAIAADYYFNQQKMIYAAQLNAKETDDQTQPSQGSSQKNNAPKAYQNIDGGWIGLDFYQTEFDRSRSLADYQLDSLQLDLGMSFNTANIIELSLLSESPTLNASDDLDSTGQDFLATQPLLTDLPQDNWWGYISYAHNLDSQWGLNIGVAPGVEQINNQYLFGGYWQADWGRLALQKSPLFESELAYLGYYDPYSNQSWGAVTQTELSYQYRASSKPTWWNVGLGISEYRGDQVVENDSQQIDFSVGQTTQWSIAEASYGLFAGYQQFAVNSNFHTFGHGGYFSPQSYFGVGPFLHLESNSKHWWRLDLGASYYDWKTDPVAEYPFTALPDQFDAAGDSDFGFSFKGEKHWLLGSHFELALGFDWQRSPQYQRTQIGITFRYLFGERVSLEPKKSLFIDKDKIFDHL